MSEITPEHANTIRKIAVSALLDRDLPKREFSEREPAYVARVIRPIMMSALSRFPELVCHGEGSLRAHEVSYAGFTFVPDLSVTHLQQRILALEAKFLVARQDSISEALGQASIYAMAGYLSSIALVMRTNGPSLQESIELSRPHGSVITVDFVIRRIALE